MQTCLIGQINRDKDKYYIGFRKEVSVRKVIITLLELSISLHLLVANYKINHTHFLTIECGMIMI